MKNIYKDFSFKLAILLGVIIFAFVLLHRCSLTYKTEFDFKAKHKNDTIKIDSNETL